ncbi:MAG TPA: hypothetical protein VFE47_10635 [Tepidisphaeraceae bacterium]|jgi:hypothetical protein|nr:hypothetical protein [Tepidisphaeraceae bacterium]
MWQQYRKTLIPIQFVILSLVVVLHFWFKANVPTILVAVVTMEIASLFGALWSRRLSRRIEAGHNKTRLGH